MKDKMMLYGVEMCARYTRKQKELFLEFVIEACKRLGRSTAFETKHTRLRHIASLEIGNVNKADIIVAAAYDTPEKAYTVMKYYPFSKENNIREGQGNVLVKIMIGIIAGFLLFYIMKGFRTYPLALKIAAGTAVAVILYGIYRMTNGIPNTVNFSRNSSGVAMVMKLAEEITSEKAAFVLLDQTVGSYEGLELLKEHIGDHKTVILLDNLSYGSECVIAHRENTDIKGLLAEGFTDKPYKEPGNALRFFSDMIQISCGDIADQQLIVRNVGTRRDHQIDMKRLEKLHELLKDYINRHIGK